MTKRNSKKRENVRKYYLFQIITTIVPWAIFTISLIFWIHDSIRQFAGLLIFAFLLLSAIISNIIFSRLRSRIK